MTIARVAFELFNGQSVWNAGTPGGFTNITAGSVARQIFGARTTGNLGFGATASSAATFSSYNAVSTPARGQLFFWIRWRGFDAIASGNVNKLAFFLNGLADDPIGGGLGCLFMVSGLGVPALYTNTATQSGAALQTEKWYKVCIAFNVVDFIYYNYYLYIGDQTTPLTLQASATHSGGQTDLNYVGVCNQAYNGTGADYEISGMYLYTGASGDSFPFDPPGLLAPPSPPATFYVRNDALGNAEGTVNTAAGALTWQELQAYAPNLAQPANLWKLNGSAFTPSSKTASQISDIIDAGGLLDGTLAWAGNVFKLGTDFFLSSSNDVLTAVCEFTSANPASRQTVDFFNTLTPTWAQYNAGTYPNVWKWTGAALPAGSAVYEDQKTLNYPSGTAILGSCTLSGNAVATIAAAINTTPGTFWVDAGGDVYISTTDGANPNTHAYIRTTDVDVPGVSIGYALSPNGYAHDFNVRGTTPATAGGIDRSYSLAVGGDSSGGLTIIQNVGMDYGGIHSVGLLSKLNDTRNILLDCSIGRGPPCSGQPNYWYPAGNTINVVVFGTGTTMHGNEFSIRRVTCPQSDLVPGSTGGFANPGTAVFYAFGELNTPVSKVEVVVCDFSGGLIGITSNVINATVTNSQSLSEVVAANLTISGSYAASQKTTLRGLIAAAAGTTTTASNVVLAGGASLLNGFSPSGDLSYNHATIDASQAFADVADSVISRTSGNLSITNSIVFLANDSSKTNVAGAHKGYSNTTLLASDYNIYVPYPGWSGNIAINFNDGATTANRTLAQMQALGYDTHSVVTTSPKLDARYRPLVGSAAIKAASDGTNVGAMQVLSPAPDGLAPGEGFGLGF